MQSRMILLAVLALWAVTASARPPKSPRAAFHQELEELALDDDDTKAYVQNLLKFVSICANKTYARRCREHRLTKALQKAIHHYESGYDKISKKERLAKELLGNTMEEGPEGVAPKEIESPKKNTLEQTEKVIEMGGTRVRYGYERRKRSLSRSARKKRSFMAGINKLMLIIMKSITHKKSSGHRRKSPRKITPIEF